MEPDADRDPTAGVDRAPASLVLAAFDTLPAQVAVVDGDGTIVATNRAWESLAAETDRAGADSVGENYLRVCEEAADDPSAASAATGIRAVLSGEREDFSFEYPCHGPSERRWYTMRVVGLSTDEGPHAVLVHVDITERKEAELRVSDHNETLETLAGVLGHDLRNPLNVAMGRAELLESDPDLDPADVAEAAAGIRAALERMSDIVDDSLVLGRGADLGELEPVALDRAARRAWSHVQTGDATLEVAGTTTFEADASLLSQLLENLFANALDHAGAAATVTVGPTENGFFVADDGPGVPPSERERVFETGHTTGGGTGLGLTIVTRVADAHGWTVDLTDAGPESGSGAPFEVGGVRPA